MLSQISNIPKHTSQDGDQVLRHINAKNRLALAAGVEKMMWRDGVLEVRAPQSLQRDAGVSLERSGALKKNERMVAVADVSLARSGAIKWKARPDDLIYAVETFSLARAGAIKHKTLQSTGTSLGRTGAIKRKTPFSAKVVDKENVAV